MQASTGHHIHPIIQLANNRELESVQLAAEIIGRQYRGVKGRLFIGTVIEMVIADGQLTSSENHMLRFLADLLHISADELSDLFGEATGKNFHLCLT